jgi:hypothetical protein
VEQQQQYVGIDLHRRRSVIVRRTPAGETLESPDRSPQRRCCDPLEAVEVSHRSAHKSRARANARRA